MRALLGLLVALCGCAAPERAPAPEEPHPLPVPEEPHPVPPAVPPTAPEEPQPAEPERPPLAVWGSDTGTRVTSNDGAWLVKLVSEPDPIPLNEPFGLRLSVFDARDPSQPAQDVSVSVDAGMPQHRHGMLRVPRVEAEPDGTWAVAGMLFHMPGAWELYVDVTREGITERAQLTVEID